MKRGFLKNGLGGETSRKNSPSEGPASRSGAESVMDSAKRQATTVDLQVPALHFEAAKDNAHPTHPVYDLLVAQKDIMHSIIKFGGEDNTGLWDTTVITRVEGRQLINAHPGYRSSIGSELAACNATLVEVRRPPGGKGLGLLAKKNISAGELVVTERPLLFMIRALGADLARDLDAVLAESMCPSRRAAYYQLFNCSPEGPNMSGALGIALTNNVGVKFPVNSEHSHLSIYDLISRANHDCTPNAKIVFNHAKFCGELISIVPIKAGSEVTISYTDPLEPAKERKSALKESWNFVCTCAACDPSSPAFTKTERARKFLKDAYKKADTQATEGYSKQEELCSDRDIEHVLSTIDATRLFDLRFGFLYLYAVAEYRHIGKTFKLTKAAALAGRALDELRKGGMQHVREEMKVQLDGIVARNARLRTVHNSLNRNTPFQGLEFDQLMRAIPRATLEDFEKNVLSKSEADRQALRNDTESLFNSALTDGQNFDRKRQEFLKKHNL